MTPATEAPSTSHDSSVSIRLSVMMFLQFFAWGAWFATLGHCLDSNGLGEIIGDSYLSAPIAAIFAPLFLGIIADRFFPSQVVMGVLFLIGGAIMALVPGYIEAGNNAMLVNLFIAYMLCYMPTIGLGNSISFANISDQSLFPRIRVWGTIGWILAGLLVGFLGWSASVKIFWLASGFSIALGVYSFMLPHTPPPARGKPLDLRAILMLDAFQMLKNFPFLIFMACSALICIPAAYYYAYTSSYLGQVGFSQPASVMTFGQVCEILFMLLIPFLFRRLGVKWMILIGMIAWALRYLLYALGAPDQTIWMILVAVVLHGVCFDFFFVTGFMYTDKKAPAEIRGQAQSMLVFFTQGIGMFVGYMIAGNRFDHTVTKSKALGDAIQAARPPEELSFLQQLKQMFSFGLPEGLNENLLSETMSQWQAFWYLPAGMSVGALILFALLFRDSKDGTSEVDTTG